MRKFFYIIFTTLIVSCVGGTVSQPSEGTPSDSDSVLTIVNIVDTASTEDTTLMNITPQQVDSLMFRLTHHYSENFNFLVKADSLQPIPREGDLLLDTCHVYKNDIIAVAAIKTVPGDSIDSIWVKVASNQTTMGWIPESELLKGATPDDLISELLDALSSSRVIWMSALIVIGLIAFIIGRKKTVKGKELLHLLDFLDEMQSPYPALFLLFVAIMASLYASVQNFVPEFWQEYYFHPTLNPLVLPPIMATLVVVLWLVIITLIAVIDEVYHHFYFMPGIIHLTKIVGAAMMVYIVVSWTTLIYVGYILLAVLLYLLGKVIIKTIKATPN